jgi:hypothetical protein
MTTVAAHRSEGDLRDHIAQAATTGVKPTSLAVMGLSLSTVIEQAHLPAIDFLSLDVEGFELAVISGLDLARHTPLVVMVETSDCAAVTALLGTAYVGPAAVSHHDFVWVRKDWLSSCRPSPLTTSLHQLDQGSLPS